MKTEILPVPRPAPKKGTALLWVSLCVLVVSAIVIAAKLEPPAQQPQREPVSWLRPDQREFVLKMKSEDFLYWRAEESKAWIDPDFWKMMDAKRKEDFAATVAMYCAELRGDDRFSIELIDKRSAKGLADWNRSDGLKVK